jgi:hypothetical protein
MGEIKEKDTSPKVSGIKSKKVRMRGKRKNEGKSYGEEKGKVYEV